MPMPTRRAIRPDGKHHRNARRRRITDGGDQGAPRWSAERNWLIAAFLAFVIFCVCLVDAWVTSGRASNWVRPVGFTALLIMILRIGGLWWQGRD